MKTMQRTSRTLCNGRQIPSTHHLGPVLSLLLLSALLLCNPYAAQAERDWTTVGAAGTVDEADRDKVVFSGGFVTMRSEATGTLNLRYNVVAVDGLFGGNGAELGVRFRDNGPDARVVVRLKRYNLVTGATATLLTLNSDDFEVSDSFQLATEVDGRVPLGCG
jgi:hypothetical protein